MFFTSCIFAHLYPASHRPLYFGQFNCQTYKQCACYRGVARIFQRGGHRQGHHQGIADYIWFIPLLSLVYQRAQLYHRGMKAHIN